MPTERAAAAKSPAGDHRKLTRCVARAGTLPDRLQKISTALQVV
jgi:hypothetical protein